MKRHHKSRLRHRPLFVESLETRAMLAGNVTASVRSGTLFVTGDNLDNDVVIQQTGTTQFSVVGVTTTVNGKPLGTPFVANNVRNFQIDLRDGHDTLGISNSTAYLLALQAEFLGGPEAPVGLLADSLTLRGYANIRTGVGDDNIAVQLQAGLNILVDAGAGSDNVVVEGSTATALLVNADTANQSTDGDDFVRVRGVTTARGSIVVNTFTGDDGVQLADDSALAVVVNAGVGATSSGRIDDDVVSAVRISVRDIVLINTGAADDSQALTDISTHFLLSLGGSGDDLINVARLDVGGASLVSEGGNDEVTLDDTLNAEDVAVPIVVDATNFTQATGVLHIETGAGDDTVNINGDVGFNPALGGLNVWTFAGNDTVSIANVGLTGNVAVDLGAGEDELVVATIATDASVLVFTGTENDIVTMTSVAAAYLLTVGGSGNDDLAFAGLDVENASLIGDAGNDTITVDDTINALDPATPILVDATNFTQVTGLLHIESLAGDDTVNINGDAAFNPSLGRLEVWTYGGIDTVSISNITATGNIAIDLTEDNDALTLDTVSTDGELTVYMGSGDDTVTATNTTAAGGARARYFGSLGDDTFTDGGGNGVQDVDYFLIDVENELP